MQDNPAKTACKRGLPRVHTRLPGRFHAELSLLTKNTSLFCALLQSPSARRVWIEILVVIPAARRTPGHPPHGGCGLKFWLSMWCQWGQRHPPHGGCGLKCFLRFVYCRNVLSPSARRVWIEMTDCGKFNTRRRCHPPHGGCGLKSSVLQARPQTQRSPSARRVWIEIAATYRQHIRQRSPSARRVWIEIAHLR